MLLGGDESAGTYIVQVLYNTLDPSQCHSLFFFVGISNAPPIGGIWNSTSRQLLENLKFLYT